MSSYHSKLAFQGKRKKERKAKAASSSSLFGFLPFMLVPYVSYLLLRVSVTTTPSSTSCAMTFSTSSPIVSAASFVSPGVHFVCEPSRKRKEDSGTVLISKEECGPVSRSTCPRSLHHRPVSLARLRITQLFILFLPVRLAPHRLPRPEPLVLLVCLGHLLLLTWLTHLYLVPAVRRVCLTRLPAHLFRLT